MKFRAHASPFALRSASRACAMASQFCKPSWVADWSSFDAQASNFSNVESKSGAEAMRFALARLPLWRAQISLLPCLMMPQVGSCFQGPGVWSVFFIILVGLVWCSVEVKIGGEDYRKRSRPVDCAGVERQGMTRDMERKRYSEAIRAKHGDG